MIRTLSQLPASDDLVQLQNKTSCPYSKRANLFYVEENGTKEISLAEANTAMKSFLQNQRQKDVDILFMCFRHDHTHIDQLVDFFYHLMNGLFVAIENKSIETLNFNDERSKIELDGVTFFITVHSPIYAESHSRHAFGCNTVIGFQPYESFARFKVLTSHQESVRKKFTRDGKPYAPSAVVDSQHELEKFIKPMDRDSPPIKWWIKRNKPGIHR
ncbi:hypothetical protein VIBNISOn1_1330011 [Vibrio nigripulchritudo SOn1]|uniref:YqcI/YcgG family protein n=1 Tax=Vibrio nigripulchritudo SOn1 TaxID=1238450 RepID=A0AAV2VKP4_9VIBR|nr:MULTISPECIES: YqcI/YcgG family protein [Vibrio]UAB73910.1 YqcI/YcgG family protein [Vibrio sp. SCSIO 43132]CCO45004.1 hypothetical protein VIBNISOn1_1330011 [Vibrio nigripulchritudo SOn1]